MISYTVPGAEPSTPERMQRSRKDAKSRKSVWRNAIGSRENVLGLKTRFKAFKLYAMTEHTLNVQKRLKTDCERVQPHYRSKTMA